MKLNKTKLIHLNQHMHTRTHTHSHTHIKPINQSILSFIIIQTTTDVIINDTNSKEKNYKNEIA